MKLFKTLGGLLFVSLLVMSCGMGHDYNLSINPPGQTDTPEQIFPKEINGEEAKVNQLEFGGIECTYGAGKSITVARLSSEEEAISFFKEYLLPSYQKEGNNFSATVNGQFYAKASGNWTYFGWVNSNFMFSLKASDKEQLSEIVENFKFIEKK